MAQRQAKTKTTDDKEKSDLTSLTGGETFLPTTTDMFWTDQLEIMQPKQGFRAGMDTVLLAAAITAKQDDRVLELGCGVGTLSIMLARKTKAYVAGIDCEEAMITLARQNAKRNVPDHQPVFSLKSVEELVEAQKHAKIRESQGIKQQGETEEAGYVNQFDQVVFNPPYFRESASRKSPHEARTTARIMPDGGADLWVGAASAALKPKGHVTLVCLPHALAEYLLALQDSFGAIGIKPIHTTASQPARLVLIKAQKGAKTPLELRPPLITHNEINGTRQPNAQTKAITAHGDALTF